MWIDSWSGWLLFFLVVQVVHFLGTWKLYEIAGKKKWEAAVPIYNAIVLLEIIKRPKWWVILLFVPIISPIMMAVIWVDTVRCFGKRGLGDALLAIFTLGFYIYYLNYVEKPPYTGPEDRKETIVSALLFAVVLATIIHTFFVQPMIIPTGSMENTMKIGDALFVSKNVYGTRIPHTPVAVPFADLMSRDMYSNKFQIPYTRILGWDKPEKNDIVVFNFPADKLHKPVDRKDNYVKRLVGEPGDVIKIENSNLIVNDKDFVLPEDAKSQFSYQIEFKTALSPKYIQKDLDLVATDYKKATSGSSNIYQFSGLTDEMAELLINNPNAINGAKLVKEKGVKDVYKAGSAIDTVNTIFPINKDWNRDWYGPLEVPKKGQTITLNDDNFDTYYTVIKEHEGNKISRNKEGFVINGISTNQYTFKQDYYFMMGDNRHNSLDSRYFGFVPEENIVGKPFFLWANLNQIIGFEPRNGFHFERWFTIPNNGNKDKTSYLLYFLIAIGLYFGWKQFSKRKK